MRRHVSTERTHPAGAHSMLEPGIYEVLEAALDRILPGGTGPGAKDVSAVRYAEWFLRQSPYRDWHDAILEGIGLIETIAAGLYGAPFARCTYQEQDAAIAVLASVPHPRAQLAMWRLIGLAIRGFLAHPKYGGNRDQIGWRYIGFRPDEELATRVPLARTNTSDDNEVKALQKATRYPEGDMSGCVDVAIVGSGAGGAALAWSLTRSGLRVIVLEKGPRYLREHYLHDETAMADRMGFFLPQVHEDPHVLVNGVSPPERTTLGWTASCVGGGTVHMGATLYRFSPDDFCQRTMFGNYEEVSDWPYSYEDLEPYYCIAEQQLGISGESRAYPFAGKRSQGYPMPPLKSNVLTSVFDLACAKLGLNSFATPRAINSLPYGGRPPCQYCDFCAGFGCPVGARGTAQETLLARAEQTGLAHISDLCFVREITVTPGGRASGYVYFDRNMKERRIRARVVCVCCSAVESARLLLLSTSPSFPDGLGNGSGLVGRHLQFHSVSGGIGRFRYDRHQEMNLRDPNHFLNRSIMDFYLLRDRSLAYPKGGLLRFDLSRPRPIAGALRAARPGSGGMLWGSDLKEAIHAAFHDYRELEFEAFHDFIPNRNTWLALDPDVRDKWRVPVARMHLGTVSHHAVAGHWLADRGLEILTAMGADEVFRRECGAVSRVMVHGTCRAGSDPSTSVLNQFCQSHEVPNLFVVDGSFMPTSGGVPSTLTIVANALRTAEWIVELARRGDL
jgi:choline dehydrogenase-like flavoprotein